MSDIRKMTTEELAKTIAFNTSYSGSHVVNSYLHELTRRLEVEEAKAATYWAECEAWRKWKKCVVNYWTAEKPDPQPLIDAMKTAVAATDAARNKGDAE